MTAPTQLITWLLLTILHLLSWYLSKWAAMKTPAPHSSAGHSRLKRLIFPLSSTYESQWLKIYWCKGDVTKK